MLTTVYIIRLLRFVTLSPFIFTQRQHLCSTDPTRGSWFALDRTELVLRQRATFWCRTKSERERLAEKHSSSTSGRCSIWIVSSVMASPVAQRVWRPRAAVLLLGRSQRFLRWETPCRRLVVPSCRAFSWAPQSSSVEEERHAPPVPTIVISKEDEHREEHKRRKLSEVRNRATFSRINTNDDSPHLLMLVYRS